jgi:hypothetical protein
MICAVCGKTMLIRTTGRVKAVKPPLVEHGYWCGEHEWQGDTWDVRENTVEEIAVWEWQKLNGLENNKNSGRHIECYGVDS